MEAARKQLGNENVVGVEVGVHAGIHANEILTQWKGVKTLHLVDNYCCGTKHYGDARLKLECFKDRIVWHLNDSLNVAEESGDLSFDFVYIDASHAYKSVQQDCWAWWPKVKNGGVLCGHDYRLDWENMKDATPAWKNSHGVVKAVDEFVKLKSLKLNAWVKGSGSSWWIIK